MRSIVTDPFADYIFVTDFIALRDHINALINQACRTVTTTTPMSTTSGHIGSSTLNFHTPFSDGCSKKHLIKIIRCSNEAKLPSLSNKTNSTYVTIALFTHSVSQSMYQPSKFYRKFATDGKCYQLLTTLEETTRHKNTDITLYDTVCDNETKVLRSTLLVLTNMLLSAP